jgi:hypothetical protein
MNVPNFKNVLQKISVLKSNPSLLVSIIIIVVAVVLFIPTRLISGKLKEQIKKQSITNAEKIRRIDAVSAEQWKLQQQYQQAYADDANQIALLAKQSTQRELLSYKIFPEPKDKSVLIFEEFGKQFRAEVKQLLADLGATESPTDSELERILERSAGRSRLGRRSSISTMGDRMGQSSYGLFSQLDATIIDEVCLDKAKSGRVYANPTDVDGYEFWDKYEYSGIDEAVKDCWYWQLGYWIIEDVIATIDMCNSGSNSILTSPVRRFLNLDFALVGRRRVGPRPTRAVSRSSEGDNEPKYVMSAYDGFVTPPCTGRFSNDNIDVVHFNVAVVVAADSIFPFMKQLCSAKEHKFKGFYGEGPEQSLKHNQISILESNIETIDPKSLAHRLYRYGEDAVVELNLICEYIFDKEGYEQIKPKVVIEALAQEKEKTSKRR